MPYKAPIHIINIFAFGDQKDLHESKDSQEDSSVDYMALYHATEVFKWVHDPLGFTVLVHYRDLGLHANQMICSDQRTI
mgnify:CR=1 FL=1